MIATKYTLEINVEALSKDSFRGLIFDVLEQMNKEVDAGKHHMDDGDSVSWNLVSEKVVF